MYSISINIQNHLYWYSTTFNKFIVQAFAEVRQAGHYYEDNWKYINHLMESYGRVHTDTWGGCVSNATTGSGTTVYFSGTMTLQGA